MPAGEHHQSARQQDHAGLLPEAQPLPPGAQKIQDPRQPAVPEAVEQRPVQLVHQRRDQGRRPQGRQRQYNAESDDCPPSASPVEHAPRRQAAGHAQIRRCSQQQSGFPGCGGLHQREHCPPGLDPGRPHQIHQVGQKAAPDVVRQAPPGSPPPPSPPAAVVALDQERVAARPQDADVQDPGQCEQRQEYPAAAVPGRGDGAGDAHDRPRGLSVGLGPRLAVGGIAAHVIHHRHPQHPRRKHNRQKPQDDCGRDTALAGAPPQMPGQADAGRHQPGDDRVPGVGHGPGEGPGEGRGPEGDHLQAREDPGSVLGAHGPLQQEAGASPEM